MEFLNAGMDDHVAKPVDMSILIAVITKHIERWFIYWEMDQKFHTGMVPLEK